MNPAVFIFALKLFCLCGIILGIFLLTKPKQAINMQIKFYKRINWKMQSVSMDKEIRNTKVMGRLLIAASLIAVIYLAVMRILEIRGIYLF